MLAKSTGAANLGIVWRRPAVRLMSLLPKLPRGGADDGPAATVLRMIGVATPDGQKKPGFLSNLLAETLSFPGPNHQKPGF